MKSQLSSQPTSAAAPVEGRTPAELLVQRVARQAAASAWRSANGRCVSWLQLGAAAGAAAAALRRAGVNPGDRIITRLENGWPAAVAALAIQLCDAIESPVDVRYGRRRAIGVASRLAARLQLDEASVDRWIPPENPASGDCASPRQTLAQLKRFAETTRDASACGLILWTSGTTDAPKGVMLSKAGLVANARGKLAAVPQTPSDRRLSILPWSHAYARTCDLMTWLASGSQLAAAPGWRAIERLGLAVRPTLINAVPAIIDRLLAPQPENGAQSTSGRMAALGFDQLRVLGCGGAALPIESFRRLAAAGVIPLQGYGLTEAGPVVCSAAIASYRPGTVGVPISDTQVRLGEGDELQVRGPGVMLGYWCDPQATAGRFTSDGWLRSGDVAARDASGDYRILGRADEVLVLGNGRKLFPAPWERELSRLSGATHLVLQVASGGLQLRTTAAVTDEQLRKLRVAYDRLRQASPELPSRCEVIRDATVWSVAGGQLTAKGTVRRHAV